MSKEELREKFRALREFVMTIPAEKLDMRTACGTKDHCGCVLFHSETEDSENAVEDVAYEIENHEAWEMFAIGRYNSSYSPPRTSS